MSAACVAQHPLPVLEGRAEVDNLLADRLEELYRTYDESFLDPDPLLIVREFADAHDREIAGLFAAAFAYGGVRTIMADLRDLFRRMNGEPFRFLKRFDPNRHAKAFDGWYHRLHRGEDAAALSWSLRRVIEEHGSLGRFFATCIGPEDRDIGPALTRFVTAVRDADTAPIRPGPDFRHLLSAPADGSACKRMNLYLRWMVRRERPDLGLWSDVPTSMLVIPLDTHVARICRYIGLSSRRTVNWRMAREITDALARIDPVDPVKYDYAICRLGILDRCPRKRNLNKCRECLIRDVCVL